jgi:2-polyprenyl-3-methyl-5-hydroxy-6-metoxy-1,4-benzoquinol methylase
MPDRATPSPETDPAALAAKYDQLYHGEAITQASGPDREDYRVEPTTLRGWPTNRQQALLYLARPGGRLLEVGCGRGEVLAALAPLYEELVGTEISATRAERTRRGLAHLPHCRILTAPLEGLATLVDPPFDCIIWADVIEHVIDVIAALRTLASLSRPGTQLVTITPNVAFLPQRVRLFFGRAPTTALGWYPNEGFAHDPGQTAMFDAGHLHYFTFRQVEILYRLAGFEPEKRLGVGTRFNRLRNIWPSLLSGLVCVSGTFQGNR